MKKGLSYAFLCLLCILVTSAVQAQTTPAGRWSTAGSLTSLRNEAVATTLRDGRVLITGGVSGETWLSSAEIYDGKTFSAIPSMSLPRGNHAAAVLNDGRVVISGGYSGSRTPTNSIEIYDPKSNQWSPAPGMTQARAGHTMTLLNDGRILIAGGMGSSGPLASLEMYDPASKSCTLVPVSMSSARMNHAAALLVSGSVLLAGGFDGTSVLDSVDAYDAKADVMYGPHQMTQPREHLTATTLLDGRVLLAGGNDGTQDLATLEMADLASGTISVVGSLSVARSSHVGIRLPNNGNVLLAGGISNGAPTSSAELFSPAGPSVRAAGVMSVARSGAVAGGNVSSGLVLVAGGESSGGTSTGDLYAFPTVSTDKPDYAPNTSVKISGAGWTPGETVTLVLHEQPTGDPDVTLTAVADSSGSFQNSSFKPDMHDQQIDFVLTAKGQVSGVFAQTIFADSTYGTQLSSPLPTFGAGGSAINASANLQYGIPQYQTVYYQYVCGSYGCNCGWGGCNTCYDYCEGWYQEYVGTYYYPLAGQPVQFSFNTGPTVTATTDSNGAALASLIVPPGATSLTATYGGSADGTYGPSTAVSNFTETQLPLLTVTATSAIGTYGQPLPPLTYSITGFLNGDTQSSSTTGAPSVGTAASSTSTPGMYPIVVAQGSLSSPNYALAFVNSALTLQQAASTVTVTSLNSSVYLNQSTTLTATVSVAGNGAAPTQTVNFMSGAALLGTATLSPIDATDSSATLTINGSKLVAGVNSITAVYSGDVNYGGSTSSAITVTLLIPQVTFASVNVGTAAPVQTLTYNFSYPTTLAAVNILTAGASGLDYIDGGASTCTAGAAYSAGQSCMVTVAFTPSAPGLRSGAVTLFAQGYSVPLMTWYVNGVGQSGAVTIDPGMQSTIATLSNNGQPYGAAIDGVGNVYVVDNANSQVIELAAGSFTQKVVVSSGLLNPTVLALDGAGNLYVSDTGNSRVVMVPNEQGELNSADLSIVSISGLGSPQGLATDGSGNLYVADTTNGNVVEIPAGGGEPITIASGLTSPQAITVDWAGNVYVAGNNQVSEYPMGGGTPSPMGTGYINPTSIAADASGAVYVADSGNARIVRVAPGGASQSSLAVVGVTNPQGVALDAAGNAYVMDSGKVYEVNRTGATGLVFASTNVGSTSAPQTVTVSNQGTQPLTVSNLASVTNFTQVSSGDTDCSSSTQLSSSGQCLIAVAFAPTTSGTLTGALTLTDNALNNPASTQTVPLSGSAVQVTQAITFPPIPSQTYGAGPLTLAATASSGLTVSYVVVSGPATVSANMLTITGAGSVTVQASQAGNVEYLAAAPVSENFTVNPAIPTVVWATPSPINYGAALTATQLNATANVPGAFVYGPTAGTVLNAGVQTLSVTFTPTDTADYNTATVSVSLTVNQAAQTISFPVILAQTYGAAPLALSATASSGLTVGYTVTSGQATVSSNMLTITGGGPVTVQASQAGNANYSAATSVSQTFTVNPASQTITFPLLSNQTYGAAPLTLTATASSGLTVGYTVTSGQATVSGNMLTITGAGPVTVQASQAGNANYSAATSVSQTFVVNPASQTITFSQNAPAIAPYSSSFTVVATASSGLPVSFSSNGVCTNVGATFTMTNSTGTCKVMASQSGNSNYLAASVAESSAAAKAAQTVTFTGAPATAPYQSSFTVTASSNSNITPTITASGQCSISGTTLTMTSGTGMCTTTARWAANSYYLSTYVTQSTVAQKVVSVITWPTPAAIVYGTALSGTQLDATASVPGSFVYSPKVGTVLKAGNQTIAVSFAPTVAKNYSMATDNVTLVVSKTGTTTALTSDLPNPSKGGQAVFVHFTVTPATSYTAPTGSVTVNASTGEKCTGSLFGGSGACLLRFNSTGARTLTATYTGDNNNDTSVSSPITQTVN